MKSFELLSPSTLERALALLPSSKNAAERDATRVMAGGQDLLGELKEHLVEPERVVNLKRIPGLERILFDAQKGLELGALATIASVAEHADIRARYPVLAQAAESIASVQIRNVGTVGGNLCQRPRCWYYRHELAPCLKKGGTECFSYAGLNKYNAILGGGPSYIVHPSDLAPALACLGADVVLTRQGGERVLPIEQFFTLPAEGDVTRETVLASDELVTRVRVPPARSGWRSTYVKFKERGSYDFALAAVALAAEFDGATIREMRLVLGGVAPVPWRCASAEKLAAGRKNDAASWAAIGEEALRGAEPLRYNAYKIPLAKGLIAQAFQRLAKA
jgi:xanthine dehydrogenase YagS FAD-binding subunit